MRSCSFPLFIVLMTSLVSSQAASLVAYNLDSSLGSTSAGVTSTGSITRDTGVASASQIYLSGAYSGSPSSSSWKWYDSVNQATDLATAMTANNYFSFNVTAASGYDLSLTGFGPTSFSRTATSSQNLAVLYSANNTWTTGNYSTIASSVAMPTPAADISSGLSGNMGTTPIVLTAGNTGYFRIYYWGATSNASAAAWVTSGTTDFSILGTATSLNVIHDLTWNGGVGDWANGTGGWLDGASSAANWANNDNATINTTGSALSVGVGTTAGAVAVGNNSGTVTISSNPLTATILNKTGSGILSLLASNNINGGVTASGGTLVVGANGALGTQGVTLNGATLSVSDPAVTQLVNSLVVGANDATIYAGTGVNLVLGGATTTAGTSAGVGVGKGDAQTFNLLTKTGAGNLIFTNNVGSQMSYTTGTGAGVTSAGAIDLMISGGTVTLTNSKTLNLGSGVTTDTYDTSTPPNQLTTYNGMVWDGDFYLQQGTVQINGGNIRGTGTIYVTNTGGTFAQRLNFNSPDIDNSVNVASGSTLTLSAASGASIKFNGLLSGSGTVANTGSGGAVLGNTNPSAFTGYFNVVQSSSNSSGRMTLKAQTLAGSSGVVFVPTALTNLPTPIAKLTIENSSTSSGAIIACPITGPGELTKAYDGDVILTGENSFSGGLVIQDAGTIYVTNTNSLGVGPLVAGSVDSRIGLAATATTNEITITNDVNTWTPVVKTNYGTVTNGGVVTTNSTNVTTTLYMMAFAPGTNSDGTARSIQLNSLVTNGGILKLSGGGNLYVNNTSNSYTGGTEIGTGNLIITNPAVLSTGPINFGTTTSSYLRFSSGNMTVTNRMTVSGVTTNSTSVTKYTANLQVDADLTATLTGGIGTKGVVGTDQKYGARVEKWGAGTLVLAASNDIAESFSLNQGGASLQANNALSAGTALNMNGGVLLLDYSGECSTGELYVNKDSILNLGAAGSGRSLRFASLASEVSTSTPVILTITNTPNGSVYFPANTTTARLAQIKSAENPTYIASVNSSGLLIFNPPKQDQTITFAALASKTVGDLPFTLGATANSGLPVTYTSSAPSVATVSGSQVTIVGEGSTTITASQIGNDIYNAAPNVPQVLQVVAAPAGTTFANWSRNSVVTSDLVYKYAFGSPNKDSAAAAMSSEVTATQLSLTAVVRTDDNKLTITAKSATNLNGPWDSVVPEIIVANASNQPDLGTGLVRKIFTILRGGENKRFLKLEATYSP